MDHKIFTCLRYWLFLNPCSEEGATICSFYSWRKCGRESNDLLQGTYQEWCRPSHSSSHLQWTLLASSQHKPHNLQKRKKNSANSSFVGKGFLELKFWNFGTQVPSTPYRNALVFFFGGWLCISETPRCN